MRLLTWNIRHGGSRQRNSDIVHSCRVHEPDVVVLTEYRHGKGDELKKAISSFWPHIITPAAAPADNTILIASRNAIRENKEHRERPIAVHRWVEVSDETTGLRILGVHIPGSTDKGDKQEFWAKVVNYAQAMKDESCFIIGDLNTGLAVDAEGTPFAYPEYMAQLLDLGWVDAWRKIHGDKREFTWFSTKGNGFRLDYAFLSPLLSSKLVDARHSHKEREQGISDHSILIVDLELDLSGSNPYR